MADEFWDELKSYKERNQMPFITTPERYGRAEGLEGLAEGLAKGIEAILELRFGDAASQLMPEIRRINDDEQLKKILHAAKTAASPDELRKLWAGESAG